MILIAFEKFIAFLSVESLIDLEFKLLFFFLFSNFSLIDFFKSSFSENKKAFSVFCLSIFSFWASFDNDNALFSVNNALIAKIACLKSSFISSKKLIVGILYFK